MTAGAMRSKRRDKLVPRVRIFLLQNFEPVWRFVERVPPLARLVNRIIINTACNVAAFRPHAMSTLGDYTSWTSLTDRTYLGRMVPPLPAAARDAPSVAQTTALFAPQGPQQQCPKSTLLFPIFAQYLTDGFLRTSSTDRAKTTSNHDIDLSPLYGRTQAQTLTLRASPGQGHGKGRLKSQWIGGEEYPPDLYRTGTSDLAAEFADAHGTALLDLPLGLNANPPWAAGEHSRRRLFAVGGDRVNSTALVAMLNTLFLREHNRLAAEIETRNPAWDDTRVFETVRNIVIVLFIKIVIEEYINHISSACFRLRADPRVAWSAPWNKPNWMTVEFSLLYRWHSLIPETMLWDGKPIATSAILLDNSRLIEVGLAKAFKWAGQTPAARLGLHNTAIYLENQLTVESRAIEQNRARLLPGYNAYRTAMGMNTVDSFDCMTGDRALQDELRALYRTPDAVDFYVGLFAEDAGLNTPMPPLLGAMVALDAFSQALNNPLLSKQVYTRETFTTHGLEVIEATGSLWDILARNLGPTPPTDLRPEDIRMTRPDWRRRYAAF